MRKGLTKSETGTYLYEKSGNIGNSGNKSRCDYIYLFPVFETCSRNDENVTAFVSAYKLRKVLFKSSCSRCSRFLHRRAAAERKGHDK